MEEPLMTRCHGTSPFGRTWDFTCSVVERHVPNIAPLLRQAHLFCFPHRPQDVLTRSMPPEQCDFWRENFALPYPITAIEDRVGLLLMWDSTYLESEDWAENVLRVSRSTSPINLHPIMTPAAPARGIHRRRFFLDIMPSWTIGSGDALIPPNRRAVILPREDAVMMQFGMAEPKSIEPSAFYLDGVPLGYWVVSKRGLLLRDEVSSAPYISMRDGAVTNARGFSGLPLAAIVRADDSFSKEKVEVFRASLSNAKCFMEEVMWFNNPDRFVVEETSETARGPRPKSLRGKIKRADERPVYHSWTPVDVRKLRERGAVDESGDPIKRRGHWRRGHFRTLRSPRYARSGMAGRTILIRPTFVGEPDFYVERAHYRLLLGKHEVLVGEQPAPESS